MSSANNKEYGDLEQSMWQRFQDAEAMPDPDVWARIDHALTQQENAKYKRRVLFYRQLAAACFVLFVLAGSALLLHFKHDQEKALLANTAPAQKATGKNEQITPEVNNTTIAKATQRPAAGNSAQGTYALPAEDYSLQESESPVLAQVQTSGTNYSRGTETESTYSAGVANTAKAGSTTGSTIGNAESLLATTPVTTGNNQATIGTGTVANESLTNYVPANQAIAHVPDNYTSPSAINPLLRRNATLGTYATNDNTTEAGTLQKQAELSLALNNNIPTGTAEEKKTSTTSSRWNVGMGFTSSYFSQNVNIPEQQLVAMQPGPSILRHSGPIVSAETAQNLVEAYDEFEKNTQAASSYNVEARTGFRVGKRFKLLAGLGYSQNTSKTKTSYIVEQFLFNPYSNERNKLQPSTVFLPSLHTFTTDSVSVVKIKQPFDVDYSYQMLSVPVGLQVEGNIGPKWFWYAMGNTAVNFLMQTTIKANNPEIADVSYGVTDDSPFRKVQFSGNVGVGIGKRINKTVSISMGPEFRSYFNSMLSDEKAVATQGRPYTIGLNMGINYTLGQDDN